MRRFFAEIKNISGDEIIISESEKVHHIRDVVRIKQGEAICVCDGKGNEYITTVKAISPDAVTLRVQEKRKASPSTNCTLTIACAIPKKAKFDEIIDKLTQLGVHRIIPLMTERVIVRLDKGKQGARHARWLKIAHSASEQSQRGTLPIVESVKTIKEVLSEASAFDAKLIPTLFGERKTLQEVFAHKKPRNALVFIGPEGDFTDDEVAIAVKAGCIPVSLGDTVLRVDTAALAVASFVKLYENS